MVVLDKSGSMNDVVGSGTKWQQVTSALEQAVMATQSQIRWGLTFFPSNTSCGTTANPTVAIAANNYNAIQQAIGARSPGGSTPTKNAVSAAAGYVAGLTEPNPKFMVLATDGQPNCGPAGANDPDPAGAVMAVQGSVGAGVHVFVVGIAIDATAGQTLDQMAQAGMEPRPSGPPYYYPVTSQQDFLNALMMIAGQIVSCTFPLQAVPPDPNNVTVTANGQTVPRDPSHMNGWDFGGGNMSIIFYGTWCDNLRNGSISDVRAILGCPPIGIREP